MDWQLTWGPGSSSPYGMHLRQPQKLGATPNLHLNASPHTLEAYPGKEIPMNAFEVLFVLTLVRLVIPFGLLLLIGERLNRRVRMGAYRG